ncbi:MAG: hypothetical protein MRJ96_12320 [Nitrospirales bacterium]|nr:hypothetical protein [Nitrospira sp.]MDR4502227.1 hypothetical protein [Nitrospirales bacterium]
MIPRYREETWLNLSDAWGLLLAVPLLIAAGGLTQPEKSVILPDEGSYRSNFSDSILDSTEWRKPPVPELPWRASAKPELDWRTSPPPKSSSSRSIGGLKLFPRYRPGRTDDFDPITREEKPLIKLFEFGR